jgi:isoleucyl-tRNA synthetase
MFRPVDSTVHFPALEAEIGKFWQEQQIYERSLERPAPNGPFIFYEGPPTANGMPHPGHCLTRAIKDLFPRYRTMRGYRCERKAGWDTHGLPVEVEVCKELGIHSKEEIEAYGVEPFIHKCQESVWRYMQEWERLTRRIGFWVNLEEAYVTYHQSYVESVWWALANLFNRGLLYQGYKIVWWWAQGGTALSSGEVGQGYREVADPSVYVKFPLLGDDGREMATSLLVWTTTPWTLPSNQFAAVSPDLEYSVLSTEDSGKIIVASALVETIRTKVKQDLPVERTLKGSELIGRRYVPPFDYYFGKLGKSVGKLRTGGQQVTAWRVVPAGFVTTDSGTGIVHQAPAFGEVDYDVLIAEQGRFETGQGPELINAVGPDGKFTDEGPEYCRSRWVKDCDKEISRDLKHRGLLFHQEQYLHDYPFCWRAEEDPLIQYPRKSWFIKTSAFKGEMLANNAKINWLPEHIKEGRFGNFLETNVDWALSRERYWGTPLPIWVCEATGHMEAVASYDELLKKPGVRGTDVWDAAKNANPKLVDDLKVHKPYIDAVTYDSPKAPGKRMRRVSEVIDCWFDSGAMPFAQWGYPHRGADKFKTQFPADFISEALDQTRGWFYSLLAESTLLMGNEGKSFSAVPHSPFPTPHFPYPHPFKNCIVLGLMLGEDGQKMSKSKRNYREPNEIFDRYGADALRWYFFANQPPWTSIRYSEQAIKDSIPEFLLRLWNVYSFFVIYANIDGFDPAAAIAGPAGQLDAKTLARGKGYRPVKERAELDRWILSELNRTAAGVTERMDAYDNFAACGQITAFVDALSNWYLRRSRDRFWSEDKHDPDKLDAYWTLYECLLSTAKLVAPFVPFLADALWQNLAVSAFSSRPENERPSKSVHLVDYPTGDATVADEQLSRQMSLVREIVSLGRNARMGSKLKVRQPLAKVELVLVDPKQQSWLESHAGLIREELNVKLVEFSARADQYVSYTVLPDLKRLGPRLGKRLPAVKKALSEADAAKLLAQLESQGKVTFELADGLVELDSQDIQVRLQAKEGWAAAQGPSAVVVISTELTPALVTEGWARELVHVIQGARKDLKLEYTDRIEIGTLTVTADMERVMHDFGSYICAETLAKSFEASPIPGAEWVKPVEVANQFITLSIRRVS